MYACVMLSTRESLKIGSDFLPGFEVPDVLFSVVIRERWAGKSSQTPASRFLFQVNQKNAERFDSGAVLNRLTHFFRKGTVERLTATCNHTKLMLGDYQSLFSTPFKVLPSLIAFSSATSSSLALL